MSNLYSTTSLISEEQAMKKPRKSTLNFLRNFAHAYTVMPAVGGIILN